MVPKGVRSPERMSASVEEEEEEEEEGRLNNFSA